MSTIEIFCMNDCPNCQKLRMLLDKEGIAYTYYNIDESPGDFAEATFRGIMDLPFPVVYKDGERLEPATPQEYVNNIKVNI